MLKVSLPRSVLRAAVRFAAKNDIRYYLNGVLVECHRCVAYVVGTNGHFLGIGRVERDANNGDTGTGSFIIPREFLEKMKLPRRLSDGGMVQITVSDLAESGAGRFTIADVFEGTEISGATLDGRFPDWRHVIPDKVSGEAAQYSAEYLALMAKAASDLGYHGPGNGYSLGQNGRASALVTFYSLREFLAVIMPVRDDAPTAPPEWVREDSENLGRVLDVEEAHAEALKEEEWRNLPAGTVEEIRPANEPDTAESQGFRVEYFAAAA